MTGPPAARPDASPETATRAATVEVRYADGGIIGRCTDGQADELLAAGLAEWRGSHRPHVRLAALTGNSHQHGGRRTWDGPVEPGQGAPARYAHNGRVCAGYRHACIGESGPCGGSN